MISQESNHTNFNYYKVSPTSKDPIIGGTRKFIEYYNREDQESDDKPLNRKPKILLNENSEFYATNENEVDARDQQQPFIIIENNNDEIATHPNDFTSEFLNIDSKTIHIMPNDKSLNSRNQDSSQKIHSADESFLNTLETLEKEKKIKQQAAAVRSVIPEKFLTPVHVGIVLMNENELTNNPTKKSQHFSSPQQQQPSSEFMPVVGVDMRKNVENSQFIPSELMSQTMLPSMLMGNPISEGKFAPKRPVNFVDTVQLTNPPKRAYKQSPTSFFLNEFNSLFNFDEILSLLTGKKTQPQPQQQQQPQSYSNFNKLSPSSSNINAIKKPLHSKYFTSTSGAIRPNRMPKYMTIPLAEYQNQDYNGKRYASGKPIDAK